MRFPTSLEMQLKVWKGQLFAKALFWNLAIPVEFSNRKQNVGQTNCYKNSWLVIKSSHK